MTEKAAVAEKPAPKETKVAPQQEAIMACGCRVVIDATDELYCADHDTTEVKRVIVAPPAKPAETPGTQKNGGKVAPKK